MAKTARAANSLARRHPGLRLAAIRQIHLYVGVFIAPSLLFFAFTGALQLFGLHEAHGDYHPPAMVEALSKVHKDQVFAAKARPEPAAATARADHLEGDHADAPPRPATLALKAFFLLVVTGLIGSTFVGLWMALTQSRRKAVAWLLFLAGAAIPIVLLSV